MTRAFLVERASSPLFYGAEVQETGWKPVLPEREETVRDGLVVVVVWGVELDGGADPAGEAEVDVEDDEDA